MDILNAELLMPIELAAGEVDESTCSLLVSDMAMAAPGTSALNERYPPQGKPRTLSSAASGGVLDPKGNKIAALNNTRITNSVLDFSANMFPPKFGLQPGKFP